MMESVLDARTQLLVAVAAAVAGRCQSCFVKLYGAASDLGVSDREIRATVSIATTVNAKAQEFMASFIAETTKGAVPATPATGACGCA